MVDKTAIFAEADREQIPKLLNALGSLDLGLIQRTTSFLSTADKIVSRGGAAGRTAGGRSAAQSNPDALAAEITTLLEGVSGLSHGAGQGRSA